MSGEQGDDHEECDHAIRNAAGACIACGMQSERQLGANGVDDRPLGGWVIACVGVLVLIGQPDFESDVRLVLRNPLELRPHMMADQRGSVQIGHVCNPCLLLASLDRVTLPPDTLTIPLESLSLHERRQLAAAVRQGDEMIKAIRLAQSGIVPGPPGGKMPRMPPVRRD